MLWPRRAWPSRLLCARPSTRGASRSAPPRPSLNCRFRTRGGALQCPEGACSANACSIGKGTCKCMRGLVSSPLTARWLPHRPVLRRGDKEYPPSTVLGIGKGVSSGVFGVTSAIALVVGLYCVAQSNLLNILSGSTVNGWYVAGSLLVPYSWGLHVASWIQKQNGK